MRKLPSGNLLKGAEVHFLRSWVLRCHGDDDGLLGRCDLMLSRLGPALLLHLWPLSLRFSWVLIWCFCAGLSAHQHRWRAGGLSCQNLKRTIEAWKGRWADANSTDKHKKNLNIAIICIESITPVLLPDARLFSVATAADVCLPFWAIGRTGSWCNPGTRLRPSPPCTALSTVWITRSLFCWASAPNETRAVI